MDCKALSTFVDEAWWCCVSAMYLRQSILLSAYETPDTRSLYCQLKNVAGKIRTTKIFMAVEVPAGLSQVNGPSISCSAVPQFYLESPPFRLHKSYRRTGEAISVLHDADSSCGLQICSAKHEHHHLYSVLFWLHPNSELLSKATWGDIFCVVRVRVFQFSHYSCFILP